MRVQLSVAVMAVRERIDRAEALAAALDADLFVDEDRRGPWWNARRCWESARGTHRLVLQDDVTPCDDFLEVVRAALDAVPDQVVSLYRQGIEASYARRSRCAWTVDSMKCWGPALLLPVGKIQPFVAWREENLSSTWNSCDGPLALWTCATGGRIWATAPSLVQHDESGFSTINDRKPNLGRRAPWFSTVAQPREHWTRPPFEVLHRVSQERYLISRSFRFREGRLSEVLAALPSSAREVAA